MDRKFNDFSNLGRRFNRFDSYKRDKFRGILEDARGRTRGGSGDFRDNFRRNLPDYRDDLPTQKENIREKEVVRDGDDGNNFSEKSHERQFL